MNNIDYKNLIFDKEAIMNLYLENKWFAYTNEPASLYQGILNSLDVIGAYDGDKLVGLIRTIGDSETIIYIQDILVLPSYQRNGIGTKLLQTIIDKYAHVRQLTLTTDNTPKTTRFYESLGFASHPSNGCISFTYKR